MLLHRVQMVVHLHLHLLQALVVQVMLRHHMMLQTRMVLHARVGDVLHVVRGVLHVRMVSHRLVVQTCLHTTSRPHQQTASS